MTLETPGPGEQAARPVPALLLLRIIVRGTPAPQGSKSAFRNKRTGRIQQVESSAKVGPWRDAVRADAVLQLASGHTPFDCPLSVDMVLTFARPKSHYRTGRNAHLLRDGAPVRPAGDPDLSKLARSTEDALTDAGVWRDDARVVEYGRLAKVYAGEDPDALDTPGAVIRIYAIGGQQRCDPCVCDSRYDGCDHANPCRQPNDNTGRGPWCAECNRRRLDEIEASLEDIRAVRDE